MRWLAVLGLGLLWACGGDDFRFVVPSLPDDARFGALIVTGATGRVWTTPFAPIESGAVHLETQTGFDEDDRLLFVAITEDERLALGVSEADLASTFVRLAGPTDAPFVPSFASTGVYGGDSIELAPTDSPELTAAWMPECPDLFATNPAPLMLTNCTSLPCESKTRADGCELEIDLSHCDRGLGLLRGTLDGRGYVDFGKTERLGQCQSTGPLPPATLDIACDGGNVTTACHLQLYADEPEPEIAEIESISLLDIQPVLTQYIRGRSPLGHLTGLASLSDRVVVATSQAWLSEFCRPIGPAVDPSPQLVFIDPDTMELIRTTTAPFCLRHMRPDPLSDGFIGVYRDRARQPVRDVLARFDLNGELVQTEVIDHAVVDIDIHTAAVLSILQDPDKSQPSIFIGLGATDVADVDNPEYVLRYDARSFALEAEPLYTSSRAGRNIVEILQPDDRSWVFLDGGLDVIQYLTFAGQSELQVPLKIACAQQGMSPGRALVDRARGQLVFLDADVRERAAYAVTLSKQECFGSAMPGGHLRSSALVLWPNGWTLVFGFDQASTSSVALAGFFDPAERRFLPEVHELGEGSVLDAVTDARGRVWATLTDAGQLVRLSPR